MRNFAYFEEEQEGAAADAEKEVRVVEVFKVGGDVVDNAGQAGDPRLFLHLDTQQELELRQKHLRYYRYGKIFGPVQWYLASRDGYGGGRHEGGHHGDGEEVDEESCVVQTEIKMQNYLVFHAQSIKQRLPNLKTASSVMTTPLTSDMKTA